jgi:class I fructose-bisphosphate aldolase
MTSLDSVTKNGKSFFLAYDQGFEHGPVDFNDESTDPANILKIAESGFFTGVIVQKGIAKQYYDKETNKVPLIVKLNGKTTLQQGEPYSPLLCTVQEAIDLGAKAIGYTIYTGSAHQEQMMKEFASIENDARKASIPIILWMYPRGKSVEGKEKTAEILEYAARLGLELGADMIKINFPVDPNSFHRMVEVAGKTKVVVAGGTKTDEESLYKLAEFVVKNGGAGLAVGRNIWQSDNPLKRTKRLHDIIFNS